MTIKLHFKFVHVCHNHGASLGSSEEGLKQTSLETIWQPQSLRKSLHSPFGCQWMEIGCNEDSAPKTSL